MKNSMLKKRKTNPKVDYFEQLPDEVLLHIIDSVSKSSDINTLFRLRTLSHRFNSLVIDKTKHLFLQVDKFERIFGMGMGYDARVPTTNFANRKVFLRCFNHVTKLVIELPAFSVDYRNTPPEHEVKCVCKNLKNCCVILCHAPECYCQTSVFNHSCPFRLASTKMLHMHSLIKKCAFIAMNLVPHLENLVSLVLKDSKGDLEMVMEEEEIREVRDTYDDDDDARVVKPVGWYSHRIMTNVDEGIDIGGGLRQVTIALAVVVGPYYKEVDDEVEADLVKRALGSEVHGMAIEKLFRHCPGYLTRYGPT